MLLSRTGGSNKGAVDHIVTFQFTVRTHNHRTASRRKSPVALPTSKVEFNDIRAKLNLFTPDPGTHNDHLLLREITVSAGGESGSYGR